MFLNMLKKMSVIFIFSSIFFGKVASANKSCFDFWNLDFQSLDFWIRTRGATSEVYLRELQSVNIHTVNIHDGFLQLTPLQRIVLLNRADQKDKFTIWLQRGNETEKHIVTLAAAEGDSFTFRLENLPNSEIGYTRSGLPIPQHLHYSGPSNPIIIDRGPGRPTQQQNGWTLVRMEMRLFWDEMRSRPQSDDQLERVFFREFEERNPGAVSIRDDQAYFQQPPMEGRVIRMALVGAFGERRVVTGVVEKIGVVDTGKVISGGDGHPSFVRIHVAEVSGQGFARWRSNDNDGDFFLYYPGHPEWTQYSYERGPVGGWSLIGAVVINP